MSDTDKKAIEIARFLKQYCAVRKKSSDRTCPTCKHDPYRVGEECEGCPFWHDYGPDVSPVCLLVAKESTGFDRGCPRNWSLGLVEEKPRDKGGLFE